MIRGQNLAYFYLEGYRGHQDTPDLELRASPRFIWIGTAATLERDPRQVAEELREKFSPGTRVAVEVTAEEQGEKRVVDRLERDVLEVAYDEQEDAVRVFMTGEQED
jgi:hypothetical protein